MLLNILTIFIVFFMGLIAGMIIENYLETHKAIDDSEEELPDVEITPMPVQDNDYFNPF